MTNSELDLLDAPGIGLKFLYDAGESQSSAFLKLQWCLGPEACAFLRRREVDNPMILISITDPKGHERRKVVRLADIETLIEFHSAGKHEVLGRVYWGKYRDRTEQAFLKKIIRTAYEHELKYVCDREYFEDSFGMAELEITVPGEFFAPELSARMKWWVNLFYSDEYWDECGLRQRMAVAFTVQPVIVALWIALIVPLRALIAVWNGFFLARRKVDWEAIRHPFLQKTSEICGSMTYKELKLGCWIRTDVKGGKRPFFHVMWPFFLPLNHLMVITACGFILTMVAFRGEISPLTAVEDTILGYLLVLTLIVSIVIVIFSIAVAGDGAAKDAQALYKWYDAKFPARSKRRVVASSFLTQSLFALFLGGFGWLLWTLKSQVSLGHLVIPWSQILAYIGLYIGGGIAVWLIARVLAWLLPEQSKQAIHAVADSAGQSLHARVLTYLAKRRRAAKEREEEERRVFIRNMDERYTRFTCDQSPAPGMGLRTIAAMPMTRVQQGRLIYHRLKTKVCRPAAR